MTDRKIFGTDGVRGTANQYPMTCEVALALGRAVAYQARQGGHRHRIVIGKDTRLSGYMLEMAFASGVCSMGVDALLLGPIPTPAVAYLTKDMRADAGVMISASHNSFEDNGIKIFGRDGFKLSDEKELELEQFMEDERVGKIRPTKENVGKAFKIDDARGRYISFLKGIFRHRLSLDGMRIAVDCANGAAYKVAPTVLKELGAYVEAIGVLPDGSNINDNCGATQIEQLRRKVMIEKFDIGVALDGDADRLIMVDEQGNVHDGETLLAIAAERMLRAGILNQGTVVATTMESNGLEISLANNGGRLKRTQVGDRYVVELMREKGYNLGGEKSGHTIYLDHSTTGDGMIAALKILEYMSLSSKKLSELATVIAPMPQSLVSVRVKEKIPLEELEDVQLSIRTAKDTIGDSGRVIVRYSGTENKVRVLVESPDKKMNWDVAGVLSYEIHKAIGTSIADNRLPTWPKADE